MREIVIHNWDQLQSAIFDGVWDGSIRRFRDNRFYRGGADAGWTLTPSLNRACPQDLRLEQMMLRSLMKYGYAELQNCASFWQVVAMGQQFGLPTRLLDWTYSPLVAAHFATEDTSLYDRDGVIWCIDGDLMVRQLPHMLRQMLLEQKARIFTRDMLDHAAADFDQLKALSDKPFAVFFEPASSVNRIANQYALFSMMSDPAYTLEDLSEAKEITRIIISHECKLEIRDKLDYINISERMIYPGLDGICRWIARRYAPLGPLYNPDPGADPVT